MANIALTLILIEYFDFANVFFPELVSELSKHTMINDHAIKLVDDWQLLYKPIYSLKPVELETLKIYIKTNLANGFIKFSKSLVEASIFFNKKTHRSLQLCVNY